MKKLERFAAVGGLILSFFSFLISINSNTIAKEANEIVKEQQKAHTLFLAFKPIKAQIDIQENNEARASCLYSIQLLNFGGQTDIIYSIDIQVTLFPDDKNFVVSYSGIPIINEYELMAGMNSITFTALGSQIENLNSYDWESISDSEIFPVSINPSERKEIFLLYSINYSSTEQQARSWFEGLYYGESNLVNDESSFPVTINLSSTPQFSTKTNISDTGCLSFDIAY